MPVPRPGVQRAGGSPKTKAGEVKWSEQGEQGEWRGRGQGLFVPFLLFVPAIGLSLSAADPLTKGFLPLHPGPFQGVQDRAALTPHSPEAVRCSCFPPQRVPHPPGTVSGGVRGFQGVSGQPGAPRGVRQPRCLACRSSHHPRLVAPLLPSTQGWCGMEQLMNKSIPPGAEAAKRGCKQPSSAGAAGPMAGEERLRVPPLPCAAAASRAARGRVGSSDCLPPCFIYLRAP